MGDPFQPSRDDGRSDRQVIYDHVCDASPEDAFSYDDLTKVLAEGLPQDVEIDRRRIYRAVGSANRHLLREKHRYLGVVKNYGYRMIRADEHLPVAMVKKSNAVEQLARGVELLQHVKLSEIPEAQRKLHEGQLMIMASLHSAIVESEKRHERQESIIEQIKARQESDLEEIKQRLEALESDD